MQTSSATPLADLTHVSPGRVEVRFKPAVFINAAGIAAIMQERVKLCGVAPIAIMLVLPPDAELDLAVMSADHYKANRSTDGLKAVAIVAESSMSELLVKLYFAYFPQGFPTRIFLQEDEAKAWLDAEFSIDPMA
ncbi:MAG: STAS/SEC14 domain-containing protein [Flavobacteriales bacterium]|nr:STAS/SEC14 domain-containing protein [Flavobacteriales bacterium]